MRVLLAQHQNHARRLFMRLLAAGGHEVIDCTDGASCLQILANASFQLILVERHLPDMDGLSIVSALRSNSTSEGAYVVVFVAADDESDLQLIAESGADDYLVLPASLDTVQLRLRLALRGAGRPGSALPAPMPPTPADSNPDLFSALPDAAFVVAVDGRLIVANRAMADLSGFESNELVGMRLSNLGLPESRIGLQSSGLQSSNGRAVDDHENPSTNLQFMLMRSDQSKIPVEAKIAPVQIYNQNCFMGVIRELSDRKRAIDQKTDRLLQTLTGNGTELATVFDRSGEIISISSQLANLLGFQADELRGRDIRSLVHRDDFAGIRALVQLGCDHDASSLPVFRLRCRGGLWKSVQLTAKRLSDSPIVEGILLAVQSTRPKITADLDLNANEDRSDHTDNLTGLQDRSAILGRLTTVLAERDTEKNPVTVLFIDIDRFKTVNESLGYEAGDVILAEVARRLRAHLNPGDELARVGGDEFAILAGDIHDHLGAVRLAERIVDDFRAAPFQVGGVEILVTPSIGIAVGASEIDHSTDLLRNADVAMSQAKRTGSSKYSIYESAMNSRAKERLGLEIDLQRALERDQLRVYYQPEVDLTNGDIVGVEALVRWDHPERGIILPGSFIRMAEEIGLIQPIGTWVLNAACRQASIWSNEFQLHPSFTVGVNFSADQFRQHDIVEQIQDILEITSLPPSLLRIEITENVLLEDDDSVVLSLVRLKELGIQIAIDDFGTGYSSLSYIRKLPAQVLKIDRAFVSGTAAGSGRLSITQSVMSLAERVGMEVVVEGIETARQFHRVRTFRCRRGQGFYFSRPVTATNMGFMLSAGPNPFANLVKVASLSSVETTP